MYCLFPIVCVQLSVEQRTLTGSEAFRHRRPGIVYWVSGDRESDVYQDFQSRVMYVCVIVLVYAVSISSPCSNQSYRWTLLADR